MYSPPSNDADTERMTGAHDAAASDLGVTPTGPITWGWHGRTLGRRALHPEQGACRLRVVSAPVERAGGKLWEGTPGSRSPRPRGRRS